MVEIRVMIRVKMHWLLLIWFFIVFAEVSD